MKSKQLLKSSINFHCYFFDCKNNDFNNNKSRNSKILLFYMKQSHTFAYKELSETSKAMQTAAT